MRDFGDGAAAVPGILLMQVNLPVGDATVPPAGWTAALCGLAHPETAPVTGR